MKTFIALKLKNPQAKFPEWVWTVNYKAAPNGYAFKTVVGSFDMVTLGKLADKNGLECHVCDYSHAKSIHGLPV